MRVKFRKRLDQYTVHCPTCGADVKHGSVVRGARPESTIDTGGLRPSAGIVTGWESWATDLQIDSVFEDYR